MCFDSFELQNQICLIREKGLAEMDMMVDLGCNFFVEANV